MLVQLSCYTGKQPEEAADRNRKILVVGVCTDVSSLHHWNYISCTRLIYDLTSLTAVSSVTTLSRRCGGGGGTSRNTPASVIMGSDVASETVIQGRNIFS